VGDQKAESSSKGSQATLSGHQVKGVKNIVANELVHSIRDMHVVEPSQDNTEVNNSWKERIASRSIRTCLQMRNQQKVSQSMERNRICYRRLRDSMQGNLQARHR
jgi:hypothetical protein